MEFSPPSPRSERRGITPGVVHCFTNLFVLQFHLTSVKDISQPVRQSKKRSSYWFHSWYLKQTTDICGGLDSCKLVIDALYWNRKSFSWTSLRSSRWRDTSRDIVRPLQQPQLVRSQSIQLRQRLTSSPGWWRAPTRRILSQAFPQENPTSENPSPSSL